MDKKELAIAVLFFLFIIAYTYPLASNSIIISPAGGGEFLLGAYHLSHSDNLTPEQKWEYVYFNIHKPLFILLMVAFQLLGLAHYWFLLPYFFYLLGGLFLFLFLKDKIANRVVLYGAVLVLLFNSVYFYFGLHLLPDVPFAALLMAMLYSLDGAVKPDGSFSKEYWRLAMLTGLAATLMRLDGFLVLLMPVLYYLYVKMRKGEGAWWRKAIDDTNLREYVLVSVAAIVLCFSMVVFLTERTTDVWNYPGLLLNQAAKVTDVTADIGENRGNALYVLSETILSFTILSFLFALAGVLLALRRRETQLYPAAALLGGLFFVSTLVTFLLYGEQRYVTHLFPMLVVFAAYAVDRAVKLAPLKGEYARGAIAVLLIALLIYSSYFLVHRGLGEGNELLGYADEKQALDVILPGTVQLEWDRHYSAITGYFYVQEAIRNYPGNYTRIFVMFDPISFAEYVPIIYGKKVYELDIADLGLVMTGSDIAIVLTKSTIAEGTSYTKHLFYPEYGRHLYILTEKDV